MAQDTSIGHNSTDPRMRSIFERLVRLEQERRNAMEGIKDLKTEAKNNFDRDEIKAVGDWVKRHFEDEDKRQKRETYDETFKSVGARLGDFANLPLGAAAVERARSAA